MATSPIEWMILPLRRYADFRGRSGRPEFWWWALGYMLVQIVLYAIIFSGFPWEQMLAGDGASAKTMPVGDGPFDTLGVGFWLGIVLFVIFYFGTLVPGIAVTVRRLHDRGMSGWWFGGLLLANFVPIVNMFVIFGYIALLIVCILPGEAGPNRWGPDPKDPSQASVFE